MKKTKTILICALIMVGLVTITVIPAYEGIPRMYSEDPLELALLRAEAAYRDLVDFGDRDYTAQMADLSYDLKNKYTEAETQLRDFTWRNTFNFTNSADYFGDIIITEDEVDRNIQNMIHMLLYGDIETACEVSILDIMLFRSLDMLILESLDMDFMGYCSGMAQAAREWYFDPSKIPMAYDYAFDLPRPEWNRTISRQTHGDVTESAIEQYVFWRGSAAFFNIQHLLNWLRIFLGLSDVTGSGNNLEEFEKIAQALARDEPAVFLLTQPWYDGSEATSAHFVNAYDYEHNSNGSITLYFYNNWEIYDSDDDFYTTDYLLLNADGTFTSSKLGDSPDHNATWSRISYYTPGDEYNSIIGDLITILESLLDLLLGIDIFSPVDLTITDPMGRKVSVSEDGITDLEFPAIAVERDGRKMVLMPYMNNIPYQFELTGTDVGDYRMEVYRAAGGYIQEAIVEGTTEPGQEDLFQVTLTDVNMSLAAQGVKLYQPAILSGSAVELNWSRYDGSDFVEYQILVSDSVSDLGTVYTTIPDQDTLTARVDGLPPEQPVFFTVRVITTGDTPADSNRVGAIMPEGLDWLLYGAIGAAAFVILLVIVMICRRRKS
ncbi:MAG: fibronectin type III domain-containing protein [Candidatus Thorarchaeota archaeon]|nr:fibronectin type III domain-containing protein [Candidatus Thorarchaeota archaeon]